MGKLTQCDKCNHDTSEKAESRSPAESLQIKESRHLTLTSHSKAAQYNHSFYCTHALTNHLPFLWNTSSRDAISFVLPWELIEHLCWSAISLSLTHSLTLLLFLSRSRSHHLNDGACQNTWPGGFACNLFEVKRRGKEGVTLSKPEICSNCLPLGSIIYLPVMFKVNGRRPEAS